MDTYSHVHAANARINLLRNEAARARVSASISKGRKLEEGHSLDAGLEPNRERQPLLKPLQVGRPVSLQSGRKSCT